MSQSDFVTRGQALVSAGQYQEAVKVCRLGLLGRPTTIDGRVVLGQALLALKRFDEVLAEMRVALELDRASVPAQLLKADALIAKGDGHAALEALQALKGDHRAAPRIADAQRIAGAGGASALGFVEGTKNYPNRGADEEDTGDPGAYTRPTSLSTPRRAPLGPAIGPPPPSVLAVGDKSGTVEVDPELDGVEVSRVDDDFGDVAAPPRSKHAPNARRGVALPARAKDPDASSVELDDDELIELDRSETEPPIAARDPRTVRGPGRVGSGQGRPGGTAVRNAVRIPSGPIDLPPDQIGQPLPVSSVPPMPLSVAPAAPMPLGGPRMPLGGPSQPMPPGAQPYPGYPPAPAASPMAQTMIPNARSQIAAALPTAAALPVPPMPIASSAAAVRPTLAVSVPVPGDPAFPSAIPPPPQPDVPVGSAPPWQRGRIGADEETRQAGPIDPALAAMIAGMPDASPTDTPPAGIAQAQQMISVDIPPTASGRPHKTGVRRTRTRLQLAMWVLAGVVVIGGGVFAGFQIRAMRLRNQIGAARDRAGDAAKPDTWLGWTAARDDLADIAKASGTAENKAALARAQALLAYEFGDGLDEAQDDVAGLQADHSLDAEVARAYLALAQNDAKAARAAGDKAAELAPNDAAAQYVSGLAALLSGDAKGAIATLRGAADKDPRPLYQIGLARALAQTSQWEDALAANQKVLAQLPEQPAAIVQRGFLLAQSGRVAPGNVAGAEIHEKLAKVVGEGGKPVAEQTRGVSPMQLAYAYLALAQVDFARGAETSVVLADVRGMIGLRLDDQRLGEEACETLFALGQVAGARTATASAFERWPTSRRANTVAAQLALATDKPADALNVFARVSDTAGWPKGQAVRGLAKAQTGDLDGARADLDAALKKQPNLEVALVGRAWLDLAANEIDTARGRLEKKFDPNTASTALATVWAAILRTDPATRDQAKALLEKALAGPQGLDYGRAALELARLDRDAGDFDGARLAYEKAAGKDVAAARLESALLLIDMRDAPGGHESLEQLLEQTPQPTARLLLEAARARALVGDHQGAIGLLDQAERLPDAPKWQLDRERGRVALRRGDTGGAATLFSRALDACGDDTETFLLAADVIVADATQGALLAKLKATLPRIKDKPEGDLVSGKLALSAEKYDDAARDYASAKAALEKAKASMRRTAQAHFGLAVIAYNKHDDPDARNELDAVMEQDPSIYDAYLFRAEITMEANPKGALEYARKGVALNNDSVLGWALVGQLAHKVGDKKLVKDAVIRVGELAPNSDALRELQSLK